MFIFTLESYFLDFLDNHIYYIWHFLTHTVFIMRLIFYNNVCLFFVELLQQKQNIDLSKSLQKSGLYYLIDESQRLIQSLELVDVMHRRMKEEI